MRSISGVICVDERGVNLLYANNEESYSSDYQEFYPFEFGVQNAIENSYKMNSYLYVLRPSFFC